MKKIFFKSRNKLMKFFKENSKVMLIIIITTLIVGSVTTFASYNYFAKDIEYEKKDGTKTSVENALNDLYASSNGFVAFFNESFHDATTSSRAIDIVDFNSDYGQVKNNSLIISCPGKYTAYYSVGHSPANSTYTTTGKLALNDNVVGNVDQNFYGTDGTHTYSFFVENGKEVKINYNIVTDGNFSSGKISVFGSVVIVKN